MASQWPYRKTPQYCFVFYKVPKILQKLLVYYLVAVEKLRIWDNRQEISVFWCFAKKPNNRRELFGLNTYQGIGLDCGTGPVSSPKISSIYQSGILPVMASRFNYFENKSVKTEQSNIKALTQLIGCIFYVTTNIQQTHAVLVLNSDWPFKYLNHVCHYMKTNLLSQLLMDVMVGYIKAGVLESFGRLLSVSTYLSQHFAAHMGSIYGTLVRTSATSAIDSPEVWSQDARCLNLRSGGGRVTVPETGCGSPVPMRPVFAVDPQGVDTHCNNFTHVQVTYRPASILHPLSLPLLTPSLIIT